MKKTLTLVIAAAVALLIFVGCTATTEPVQPTEPQQPAAQQPAAEVAQAAESSQNAAQTPVADAQQPAAPAQEGITEDEAKAIALNHAGLNENDVTFVRSHLEYDDGRQEYEIEFWSGNVEYDYDIDAVTGDILNVDQDAEYYDREKPSEAQVPAAAPAAPPAANQAQDGITEAEAKAIALNHAGLKESDVTFVRSHRDYDDGRQEYDIEFWSGNVEYDYDIDAVTGSIVSFDSDAEYYTPKADSGSSSSSGSGDYIGNSKAESIALSHAGVSESQVRGLRSELDRDDGRVVYEIEFRVDRMEYDYEVDAVSGKIYKSQKELDD